MLPRFLYRGDSDPDRLRNLKSGFGSGFYLSNLSNLGYGAAVFRRPLIESVRRHVVGEWEKSHFLSFSESLIVARAFASGPAAQTLSPAMGVHWDALVLTLDTARCSTLTEVETAMWRGTYPGRAITGPGSTWVHQIARAANYSQIGRAIPILLIDVKRHLEHQIAKGVTGLEPALEKARRDREWLILPLDTGPEIHGEFTSMLDDGCISDAERFELK